MVTDRRGSRDYSLIALDYDKATTNSAQFQATNPGMSAVASQTSLLRICI